MANILERLRLINTDAGQAIVPNIEAALRNGLYGRAIHRLCYWHAVNLKYNESYTKHFQEMDHGTGAKILGWFRHIVSMDM